jgi:predicted DNA-binding protein
MFVKQKTQKSAFFLKKLDFSLQTYYIACKNGMKMEKVISLRISDFEYERLKQLSRKIERPISEVIRRAIEDYTFSKIEAVNGYTTGHAITVTASSHDLS